MDHLAKKRKYTDEEKRQLIANLDIEVAHRTRQFESWLADRLENFTIHQEGIVSRIPKQVRTMTMREFGEKYKGDIQAALRGYQKERLMAAGADANFGEIDKDMRKRKWVEGIEAEMEKKDKDTSRTTKSARTAPSPSPKKPGSSTGPGSARRQRLVSATNKPTLRAGSNTLSRIPKSPSPTKSKPPFGTYISSNPHPPSRSTSPTKSSLAKSTNQAYQPGSRVPSRSSFNPSLPPKTPNFPKARPGTGINNSDRDPPTMRLPRKDESMLSLNGSPLANPYQFGMGWFKGVEQAAADTEKEVSAEAEGLRSSQLATTSSTKLARDRSSNSIIIRRDPSVAIPSTLDSCVRESSQSSLYSASSSQAPTISHPPNPPRAVNGSHSLYPTARFPSTHPLFVSPEAQHTPKLPTGVSRTFSAFVAIPTKDGHLLEFDPLQTSPGSIDALDGITSSAKKQAKVEMGRLVQAAVDKWKIG